MGNTQEEAVLLWTPYLQSVVSGQCAGRWHTGRQKGQTLVTVVRIACTVSSLSSFVAGEGDGKETGLHSEALKGNCHDLKIEHGWRKQQVLLAQ